MKRLMVCAVTGWAAVGLLAGSLNAAEKIGVVDVARVIREYDAARDAEARLEERAEEYSAENETLLQRHEVLQQEFEKLRNEALDPALTDEARENRRRTAEVKLHEVEALESQIRETNAMRRRQLEDQRRRVFRSLSEAIRAAIARQADQDGFTLVFDSSAVPGSVGAVLYHQPSHDLTAAVIKRLNAAAEAQRAAPAAEEAP